MTERSKTYTNIEHELVKMSKKKINSYLISGEESMIDIIIIIIVIIIVMNIVIIAVITVVINYYHYQYHDFHYHYPIINNILPDQ